MRSTATALMQRITAGVPKTTVMVQIITHFEVKRQLLITLHKKMWCVCVCVWGGGLTGGIFTKSK